MKRQRTGINRQTDHENDESERPANAIQVVTKYQQTSQNAGVVLPVKTKAELNQELDNVKTENDHLLEKMAVVTESLQESLQIQSQLQTREQNWLSEIKQRDSEISELRSWLDALEKGQQGEIESGLERRPTAETQPIGHSTPSLDDLASALRKADLEISCQENVIQKLQRRLEEQEKQGDVHEQTNLDPQDAKAIRRVLDRQSKRLDRRAKELAERQSKLDHDTEIIRGEIDRLISVRNELKRQWGVDHTQRQVLTNMRRAKREYGPGPFHWLISMFRK